MHPKKYVHRVISDPDFPVVNTEYGRIRGIWEDGCYIFRGIEYAQSKRFHLPQEPNKWTGIKPTINYGPVPCELSTRIPQDAFLEPHFWYPQSECCQNMNIWTSSLDPEERLPVIVWIHGGGQELDRQ